MKYIHTAPSPEMEHSDVCDAAYFAVDEIVKHNSELVRNDCDRDSLEAAIRDLLVDWGRGRLTPDEIGYATNEYQVDGSTF